MPRRPPQGPKSKPPPLRKPLVAEPREAGDAGRIVVSIKSFRCGRAVDPDNLVGKYFVDALRYAGILHDDRPEDIVYQITQEKVKTRKEERTEITLIFP